MNLLLVAHGTRRAGGVAMIGDLAAQVSTLVGRRVQVAFVDVLGPTPSEVLSGAGVLRARDRGARVFVPRIPRPHRSARPRRRQRASDVTVTPALGPSRAIVRIVAEQLVKSGWRRGDSVILAAAGTSDRRAQADLRTTAALLSTLTGSPVDLGFVATGEPRLQRSGAIGPGAQARASGRGRVLPAGRRPVPGTAARLRRRSRQSGPGHPSRAGATGREPIPRGHVASPRGGGLIFDQLPGDPGNMARREEPSRGILDPVAKMLRLPFGTPEFIDRIFTGSVNQ